MSNAGVFYVAAGDEWVREAIVSVRSLKEHNPGLHATLYTDGDVGKAVFDAVEKIRLPSGDRRIETLARRIEVMADAPYERALRLDTDTFIMGDLSPLFDLLDRFDVASRHAPTRVSLPQPGGDVPEAFPEYCAGIVAFRRSWQMLDFIKVWASKFREFVAWGEQQEKLPPRICPYHADNASLRWALYHSDLRLATLPSEWLCVAHAGYVWGEVKIIHGRGEWLERAKRSLNARTGPRVYKEGTVI
jgi:hypothetical protein